MVPVFFCTDRPLYLQALNPCQNAIPFVIFSSFSRELAHLQVSGSGVFVKFSVYKKKGEMGLGLQGHLEHWNDLTSGTMLAVAGRWRVSFWEPWFPEQPPLPLSFEPIWLEEEQKELSKTMEWIRSRYWGVPSPVSLVCLLLLKRSWVCPLEG